MDAQSTGCGPEFSENVLDSSGYACPAVDATDTLDAIGCSVDACQQVSSHIHTMWYGSIQSVIVQPYKHVSLGTDVARHEGLLLFNVKLI